MRSEWRWRTLGELTDNFDSIRVPVKEPDRRPGPYPYYGASGVVDHVDQYLYDGEYLLVAEDGENLRTRTTPVAFLARGQFWVNNHAHVIRGNSQADTRFLMYALSAADISGYLSGSTMPKLTQANLNRIPLSVPDLTEQRRIADMLSALDDKIELNRRMSQTLESMARALFKSWFVDFGPVHAKAEGRDLGLSRQIADLFPHSFEDSELGEIPKGWQLRTVGSIAEVVDCSHAKKPDRRENGRPLLQLANIRPDGVLDMSDEYLIDDADYEAWTARIEASPGDCVITNVGRVGAVAQIPAGFRAALGRNMTAIRFRSHWPYATFLVEALRSGAMRDEIAVKTDAGTILEALNVRSIPSLRVVVPSAGVLAGFESAARPLRAHMEVIETQRGHLQRLRDTLLPRLLLGGLGVRSSIDGRLLP